MEFTSVKSTALQKSRVIYISAPPKAVDFRSRDVYKRPFYAHASSFIFLNVGYLKTVKQQVFPSYFMFFDRFRLQK